MFLMYDSKGSAMFSKNVLKLVFSVFTSIFVSITLADANVSKNEQVNKVQLSGALSLELIMGDPDWMGNSPVKPIWSMNSDAIYFERKAKAHQHNDNYRFDLANNNIKHLEKDELIVKASGNAVLNAEKSMGVFSYQGDIYLIELSNQNIRQLTSDARAQSNPQFISSNSISYRVDYELFVYDIKNFLERQIAEFKLAKDPKAKKTKNYLVQSQTRLIDYLDKNEIETKFQEKRKEKLTQSSYKTWYLGEDIKIKTFRLSPNGEWLVLGTVESDIQGPKDHMPEFVTHDGYVNDKKVRALVGTSKPTNESFYLINLIQNKKTSLDLSKLPGINDDPLEKMRKIAAKKIGYKYKAQDGARAIYAYRGSKNQGVEWSKDSKKAALLLFSYDNKDRWIVTFSPQKKVLSTAHWLSDDAWVNDWTFTEFGWMPDNKTLYYLSEEDGYSHLYIKQGKRKASQLTEGKFEVSKLTVSQDGNYIYYKANKKHPGIYEIYSLEMSKRTSRSITELGGMNDYLLSPNEEHVVVSHSSLTRKPELYLLKSNGDSTAKQITDTMSKKFTDISWQAPKIIGIKSSNVERDIYSRLYEPTKESGIGINKKADVQQTLKRPAVIFVHGAGYLQNSHQGWSGYFREFMFHNYLTNKGFVVLDMDYRASKGYGRDWRTAIYRNMGTPELEDLKDGAKWLVDNMNVDAKKIGVYGGSYGGFMTFMALFKAPDLFAAGAALRPVTDWSHYNHGYTSNILNTPQVDPVAYERSSPIEFANGLNKPLLICHGMVDDNVFFKDTVRLVQKLIELKKSKYFETAIYPVEAHGFKQASSWLDEYTRIDQLFERTLR